MSELLQIQKKASVLVVDDESSIRNLIQIRLEKIGYRVDVAGNGLHAIQKIKAGLEVHLVICDLKMPGLSGVDFLTQMRTIDSLKDIPVLVITAYPERNLLLEVVKSKIAHVMVKPFNYKDLVNKVTDLVGDYQSKPLFQIG